MGVRPGNIRAGALFVAMLAGSATAHAGDPLAMCRTVPARDLRAQLCSETAGQPGLSARQRATALFYQATAELDMKRVDAAIAALDAAVAADPSLWPAFHLRSRIREGRREYAPAIADFGKVVDANPDMIEARRQMGHLYDFADQPEEGRRSFDKAIALAEAKNPKVLAELFNDRGYANQALGDFAASRRDFEASVQRRPNSDDSLAGGGRAAYMQGDTDGALKLFGRAYDLDKTDGYTVLWLYLAETRAGRDGLIRLRERSSTLKPGVWPEPIIRVLLGEVKPPLAAGPVAPSTWSAADLHRAGECEVSFFLAEQHLLQGNTAMARQLFQAAIDTGVQEFTEYHLARQELARMTGGSR